MNEQAKVSKTIIFSRLFLEKNILCSLRRHILFFYSENSNIVKILITLFAKQKVRISIKKIKNI